MNLVVDFDQAISSLPSGFVSAVNYVVGVFDSLFTANVTVTIDVGYGEIDGQKMSPGALGESEPARLSRVSYAKVHNALVAEGAPGAATLPARPPAGHPTSLLMGSAEQKALGLIPDNNAVDGYVGFSAAPGTFSYAINAAPAAGEYYFVGVVEHEFTEVMGRTSELNTRHGYSLMDLYRFAGPGQHQFTTGGPSYFSIDNGVTNLDNWNNYQTGNHGDLGDWAPSAGNDAFNDNGKPGVMAPMTATDVTLMAALGWDGSPVPSGSAGHTGGAAIADSSGADTVVGFADGFSHHLGDAASNAAIVTSTQVGGNTVFSLPDHTSLVLAGVTHYDGGFFA